MHVFPIKKADSTPIGTAISIKKTFQIYNEKSVFMSLKTNKERVLIESKRFCALCEHQKGVKIEIHHIVQKSKGGSDDFENLIPLCFDCHSEVKSYNPEHPKGNKFSEKELRERLLKFYKRVANNEIPSESPQKAPLDHSSSRLSIEKDFQEIASAINSPDIYQPNSNFFRKSDDLLRKYRMHSFFSNSNLLDTLDILSDILCNESTSSSAVTNTPQINSKINKLQVKFVNEYQRLFYKN